MTRLRRLRRRLAVVLPVLAAMLLISTQSAHADTDIQYLWAWTKKTNVVTHEWDYVNTTGESVKLTITKEHITTVEGAIDATGGATGNLATKFFGALGIEVGLTLHGSGSKTVTHSIVKEVTIPKADGKYIYYNGTRKASGRYERWACGSHSCARMGYKSGHSWNSDSAGSISCKKPAQDGLSALVKKRYC